MTIGPLGRETLSAGEGCVQSHVSNMASAKAAAAKVACFSSGCPAADAWDEQLARQQQEAAGVISDFLFPEGASGACYSTEALAPAEVQVEEAQRVLAQQEALRQQIEAAVVEVEEI